MATQPMQFKKAVKLDARGRIALVGPAGSGKSFTALELAKELAGPEGKIAAVDTEHGSLSKYADLFDFDVIELDSYSPNNFMDGLTAAEQNGYAVFLCDSLSHFWVGKDGALEFVDMSNKRQKDQMGGWKDWRPHERAMVDRLVASPCHVIVTMRTKTEYVEEVNAQGKKVRRKVGLQPVQREGLEYEFDLVAYMDDENNFITEKTRCPFYSKKAIGTPKGKDFEPFKQWLKGEKREQPAPASGPVAVPKPEAPIVTPPVQMLWTRMATGRAAALQVFDELKSDWVELFGDDNGQINYDSILAKHGVDDPSKFKGMNAAKACVRELFEQLETARQHAKEEDAKQQTLIDVEAEPQEPF